MSRKRRGNAARFKLFKYCGKLCGRTYCGDTSGRIRGPGAKQHVRGHMAMRLGLGRASDEDKPVEASGYVNVCCLRLKKRTGQLGAPAAPANPGMAGENSFACSGRRLRGVAPRMSLFALAQCLWEALCTRNGQGRSRFTSGRDLAQLEAVREKCPWHRSLQRARLDISRLGVSKPHRSGDRWNCIPASVKPRGLRPGATTARILGCCHRLPAPRSRPAANGGPRRSSASCIRTPQAQGR